MTDTPLQRFHTALVEALRERSPADLARPFTVAEIYQDLVPYRTHRDRLGVEMNGDYEHLLLRLLAGEEGYLHLESEAALREIREELDALDPNTGLYREFAAVDVRLAPERIPEAAGPEEASDELGGGASGAEPSEETPGDPSGASPTPPVSGERVSTVALGDFDGMEGETAEEDEDPAAGAPMAGLESLARDYPEAPEHATRTPTEPPPGVSISAGK